MLDFLESFNDKDAQSSFDSGDVMKYQLQAVIPYLFPVLFFLPVISDKNSAFCRFHANQQLIWLIVWVIFGIAATIIGFIPFIGGIIKFVVWLALLAASVLLAIGAWQGKALKIPFVGDLLSVF